MRIFWIPLSRTTKTLHCHSTLAPSPSSYLNRGTNWAAKKWNELEQSPPKSIKGRIYGGGTKILDRLEHEEYFLKNVPGKEDWEKAVTIDTSSTTAATTTSTTSLTKVAFLYPSSESNDKIATTFQKMIQARIPYHKKYMIYSGLWLPITSVIGLIPLVPNIPFFYATFRLWSHWKAMQGAKHLDFLIQENRLIYQPSDALNVGLRHDPVFADFFTGSSFGTSEGGWSVLRKNVDHDVQEEKQQQLNSKGQTNNHSDNVINNDAVLLSDLSPVDRIIQFGFITDQEIEGICENDHPEMTMVIKRARHQEAEKVLQKLKAEITKAKDSKDRKTQ